MKTNQASRLAHLAVTYGEGHYTQQFSQEIAFTPGGTENQVINLYPEITDQTFDGFGGAITEAAAYVYAQMDEKQRQMVMEQYFSPDKMNYQFVRIPIDSCDFSLGQYEASSRPDLSDFSFARLEKYILPMLDDAQAAAGRKLPIFLSPWSPPAWMKTNGRRDQGGKLKEECYEAWAEYLCRYILEFQRRGYQVSAMSIQNEPKAVQRWDSCVFTAKEEKAFLTEALWPTLEKNGLTDIQIYIWDHNKERAWEWMRDIVDEKTEAMVAGIALHWYSGDHFDALDLCRHAFPGKKLLLSESCIEFYKFDKNDAVSAAHYLAHEVIGDLNHGLSAYCDWNLILDEKGGPNYVGNYCLAPVHYDTVAGQARPHLIGWYYAHFAKAIQPGSVRIASTSFSSQVEVTAWRRPDRSLAAVILNRSTDSQPVSLRLEDQEATFVLLPLSISVVTI